jgi:hypothetical protein
VVKQDDSSIKKSIVQRTTNASLSDFKITEVSVIADERKKERMKSLARNLEVCDLLDMRNV